MSDFDIFIGIDYSGAKTATSRLRGLQVFASRPANASPEHWRSPTRSSNGGCVNWTRKEVYERLLEETRAGRRFLAGIDHCFSFPESFFKRYDIARTWPDFLDDFVRHWPTHEDTASVERVRDGSMHRNHSAPPPGQRTGDTNELRICERWTSSAKSVFQFDVQGSVAKSSHAGIPWLKKLRDEVGNSLHFWPFDGWEPDSGKSVHEGWILGIR